MVPVVFLMTCSTTIKDMFQNWNLLTADLEISLETCVFRKTVPWGARLVVEATKKVPLRLVHQFANVSLHTSFFGGLVTFLYYI